MSDEIHRRVKLFQEKLGEQTRDEYYADTAARLDTIIGGNSSHYIRLRKCKEEYDRLADAVPIGQGFLTFEDFCREWYGFQMKMGGNGVSLDYTVLDEKKYTVFVLKFTA